MPKLWVLVRCGAGLSSAPAAAKAFPAGDDGQQLPWSSLASPGRKVFSPQGASGLNECLDGRDCSVFVQTLPSRDYTETGTQKQGQPQQYRGENRGRKPLNEFLNSCVASVLMKSIFCRYCDETQLSPR